MAEPTKPLIDHGALDRLDPSRGTSNRNAGVDEVTAEFTKTHSRPREDTTGKFVARQQAPEREEAPAEESEAVEAEAGTDEDAESADQQASGEDVGDDEQADQPGIEPPQSWSREMRDRWNSFDRETQEYILSRANEDDAAVKREKSTSAAARKAADEAVQAVNAERQRYAETLQSLPYVIAQLDPVVAEGLKTNWPELAAQDPASYVQKHALFTQRMQVLQGIQGQVGQVLQQHHQAVQQNYVKRLAEVVPDMVDPVKGPTLRNGYKPVLQAVGYSDAEIEQGWGVPRNPAEFKILDWAAKGYAAEQARKSLPQKKVAPNGLKIGKPQAEGSKASVAVRQLAALGKTATTARTERQRLDALTQLYERGAPTRRN